MAARAEVTSSQWIDSFKHENFEKWLCKSTLLSILFMCSWFKLCRCLNKQKFSIIISLGKFNDNNYVPYVTIFFCVNPIQIFGPVVHIPTWSVVFLLRVLQVEDKTNKIRSEFHCQKVYNPRISFLLHPSRNSLFPRNNTDVHSSNHLNIIMSIFYSLNTCKVHLKASSIVLYTSYVM